MNIKDETVIYFYEPAKTNNSLVLFHRNNVSNNIVPCQRVLRYVNITAEYTTHLLLHTCLYIALS